MQIEKNTPKLEELQNLLEQLDKPLNLTEAARYLNLSKSYLYKLTSKHKIPHYKPAGKIIYFIKGELNDWVRGSKPNEVAINTNAQDRETENQETDDGEKETGERANIEKFGGLL